VRRADKRIRENTIREERGFISAMLSDNWWYDGEKEALAHIHVGFFKGGKPEASAGGEGVSKARTAIHNRSRWRWKFRIRYRHTSIRKSATPNHARTLSDVGTATDKIVSRSILTSHLIAIAHEGISCDRPSHLGRRFGRPICWRTENSHSTQSRNDQFERRNLLSLSFADASQLLDFC